MIGLRTALALGPQPVVFYKNARLMKTSTNSKMTPVPKVYQINFFSIGSRGSFSTAILCISSFKRTSAIHHPFTIGGNTPAKNSQEISRPTQMMNPNRHST